MKRLALVLWFSGTAVSLAGEPIPATWKNTPVLGMVYKVKKAIPAEPYLMALKVGDKVTVSRRFLSDQVTRRLDPKKQLGLLLVGGEYQNDGGPLDAKIPILSVNEYLTLTNERGPNTHWEEHQIRFGDKEIPNLKPNHWFQHTFALNYYPAQKFEKERPVLIGSGTVSRMVKPSPHCLDSEVTIRLREKKDAEWYLEELKKFNPDLAIVGPWFETDYCVSYWDFIHEFSPNVGVITEALPDAMTWEEASERYHTDFVLKAMKDAEVVRVNPYTEEEVANGRTSPNIRVMPVRSLEKDKQDGLPEDGWVAEYAGNLYYACAGGQCRAQGYQIVLDRDGKVLKFLKNRLYSWDRHVELPLDKDDEERLIEICNDVRLLKELHHTAKTSSGESYSASLSRLNAAHTKNLGRTAGNSYGTFVIHVSKIREKLDLKSWPFYDGKAPQSANDPLRLHK